MNLEDCGSVEGAMYIIWDLPEAQKIQIITMWWLWWQERNNIREGGVPSQITDLAHRVRCSSAEYITCFGKQGGRPKQGDGVWQPPPDGVIKFNVDGAFVAGQTYGGWGVVARTSEGEIVAARAGCSDAVHDAFTAELRAMEEAFNLAAELGVIRAVFETDTQLLAMALNSTKADFSSEAAVIEDLKIQSRTWFSSCSIRFSRRSSNNVAHALAQAGIIMTVMLGL